MIKSILEYMQDLWFGDVIQVVLHCHPSDHGKIIDMRYKLTEEGVPCQIIATTQWQDTEDSEVVQLDDGKFVITMYREGSFFQTPTMQSFVAQQSTDN